MFSLVQFSVILQSFDPCSLQLIKKGYLIPIFPFFGPFGRCIHATETVWSIAMTHSTAGGIIRSRLRRRSEGCFDWTTYLDVLIQLYYPLQLRKRTRLGCGTIFTTYLASFAVLAILQLGHRIQLICRSLMVRLHNQSHGTGPLNLASGISTREEHITKANHASNLYLLPHMPNAGALSHTKPGTNVSHLTINTHKCRVSVDGILRRVVNNRPLRESRETCSSIFIVPSLNT